MEAEPFKKVLEKKFEFLVNHYSSGMDSIKKDIRSSLISGIDEWIKSSSFKELINKTVNDSLDKSDAAYMEKSSKIRESVGVKMSDSNSKYSKLLEEEEDLNITPELDILISQSSVNTDKSDCDENGKEKKNIEENPETGEFGEFSGYKKDKKKKHKGPTEDIYIPFSSKKYKKQKKLEIDDDDISD